LNHRSVEIRNGGMITPYGFLGPLGPVESTGLEFFQVEMKGFAHGFSVT
jgi:hypothetical protein